MSIRTKILLACISLTAITIAFGMLTRSSETQLGQIAIRLYDEAFMSMSYLRSAQNTVLTISRDVAAGSVDSEHVANRLDDAVGDIGVAVDRALSPKGHDAAAWLHDRLEQIATTYHTEQRLPDRQSLTELEGKFDRAVEINAGDGFRSRRASKDLIARISLQTWTAMGMSVALALAITFILSRAIVPAVRHAVGIATAIAGGKLDNHIQARGKSETSALLRALETMQRSIADKIAKIETLMAKQASNHATEMASQHARFETALDNMAQGLCMFDDVGRVLVHNRRFAEMFTACAPGADIGDVVPAALHWTPDGDEAWLQARSFTRTLDDQRAIAVTEKPMEGGGWVATYEDVTERHRIEARLAYIARHDALTGLPNRVFYREHMEHALAQARRGGGVAVLCLDLDRFKAINDTLGHAIGDRLLCAVAQRLRHETRETDMVVRLGGDEFAVIQDTKKHPLDAKLLAERLCRALLEPFSIGDQQHTISTSIGIALTEDGRTDGGTLLKSAELALSKAKSDGRGTFRFFEPTMDAQMQSRRRIEIDLKVAVAERQFVNYYQPLVNVETQEVSGFEALVRWRHPTRGMISPGEFISVSEEMGLITQISMLVLERACADALTWPDHIAVAVNLSPLQFRNRQLASEVDAILKRTGLPAVRLELEITESLLLQDSNATLAILHEIRALGVRVSMDDFGTGYSSLAYLHRFPFDKIKIDQSFVRNLSNDGECIAIVRAVLSLGRSLGISVLAEGVETEQQLDLLRREGCELVQGYLFSKPRPADTLNGLFGGRIAFAA